MRPSLQSSDRRHKCKFLLSRLDVTVERHVNEFSPEVINKIVYYSTYIFYCLESIGLCTPREALIGA